MNILAAWNGARIFFRRLGVVAGSVSGAAVALAAAGVALPVSLPVIAAVAAAIGAVSGALTVDLPREVWTPEQRAAKLGTTPVVYHDEDATPPRPPRG
ncbi:MAG: hypothetical protein PHR30_18425 [Gallionellaceae bacterium]|nr:hypothetical protein [Gallionellaceae bacterium]